MIPSVAVRHARQMWEAALPAITGLVGVFATLGLDGRRWERQRMHERALERDRFVRSELREQYARIISLARAVSSAHWKAIDAIEREGAEPEEPHHADHATTELDNAWREAKAEIELVASDDFNEALGVVDRMLTQTSVEIARMVTDGQEAMGHDGYLGNPGTTVEEREAIASLVAIARRELRGLRPGGD